VFLGAKSSAVLTFKKGLTLEQKSGLGTLRISLKAPPPFLLAQPPEIVTKDLTPDIQCSFFVPSSLLVLSLFDQGTGLSERFEIALFDFCCPFARHINV
jgi:hypothetical protein